MHDHSAVKRKKLLIHTWMVFHGTMVSGKKHSQMVKYYGSIYIYIYKTFSKWQSRRYGDQINDCQGIGTH